MKKFAAYKGKKIDFKDIDLKFYSEFVSYQTEIRNFATNTIGKYIAVLKVFLNEAKRQGIPINTAYLDRNFKVMTEEADTVYLTEIELSKIINVDLSNDARLDRAKDIFLLACYTGLRYSDVTEISIEAVQNGYFHIRTRKTNKNVIIPIHSIVSDILEKYNENINPHCVY